MKTHDSYRLHLTPLSPVHIGTGESYEPTNYVIDADGVLHEFDTGSVMAALADEDRRKLLAIASGRPSQDQIKQVQHFFHERQDRLTPRAVNRIPVLPGIAALYASRVGQTANAESGGGQVLNRLEIDRLAYHPASRKPVLLGSSLKGAIRTALLNHENHGQRAPEKKGLHEFQGRLFRYYEPERRRLHLERDPLRLLQLSDAVWQGPPDWPAAEVYLAVNRKKERVRDKNGQEIRAMGENLYQILECVAGWRPRAFQAQLNLQSLAAAPDSPKLPARELRYTVGQIAEHCNDFYRDLFDKETQLLQTRSYIAEAWLDSVQRLLADAQDRIRQGQVFLLRVGRHSGAEAVTVDSPSRNIRIMTARGQPDDYAVAAKTLWLAASEKDQREGLLPFGWVLAEVLPWEAAQPEWPLLDTLAEPHQRAAIAFAGREQARSAERAALLAQRQQREEEARQQAEAEEARARAEAERLAGLSANQQRAEALHEGMTPANRGQGPGSQLYSELRVLLQEAAGWDLADRQAAHTAAVAIFEYLGIARDHKQRKALLRGLNLT